MSPAPRSSKRTLFLFSLLAVVAAVALLLTRADQFPVDDEASGATPAEEPSLAAAATVPEAKKETPPTVDAKAHGADCAHCQSQKTSADAEPMLNTKPELDQIFKKLAAHKDKIIPKSTFDIFHGARIGDTLSVDIANQNYSGKVSVVRENHELARTYGMALEDGSGALVVSTDGGGYMRGHVLFIGDSRAITFQELKSKRNQEPKLAFYENRISDIFCADPDAVYAGGGVSSALQGGFPTPTTSKNLSIPSAPEIPSLSSEPNSDFVLYLDFDGEIVSNTLWNVAFYGGTAVDTDPIVALPQARADEEEWVELVWQRVAEDFAPFYLNVTTDRAAFDAADADKRVHALITSSTTITQGAGGVAFLHSFREDSPIVWVVNSDEAVCASTISHEAGHAFGLSHDARTGQVPPNDYYFGHAGSYTPGWAPIMGAFFGDGFYDEVDQWSIGEYVNADNQEDDLAILADTEDPQLGVDVQGLIDGFEDFGDGQEIYDDLYPNGASISNGFGYKADDLPNAYTDTNLGTFTMLAGDTVESTGLIESTDDVDVFKFTAPAGRVRFTVSPIDVNSIYSESGSETSGANLAVSTLLRNSAGTPEAAGLPFRDNELSSVIDVDDLIAGDEYYLEVSGGGRGAGGATGFTDYASLGQYFVFGEMDLPQLSVLGGVKPTELVFNGDTSVQVENGTDFGYTFPSGDVENIFALMNSGTTLDIENITVSLDSGDHFELVAPVPTGPIQPDTDQELTVRYAPNARGIHKDTVIIEYETGGITQIYRFAVRGVATISATKDNYENNNSQGEAFNLSLAEDVWLSSWRGLAFFGSSSSLDFYSFTTTPGDELVRVSAINVGGGNLDFELYYLRNNQKVVAGSTSSFGGIIQVAVPEDLVNTAVKYFIRVKSNDAASLRNEYDLKWQAVPLPNGGDDLYEENDTMGEAYDLTNEPFPRLSENLGLGVLHDEDWYKITIPADPFDPFTRMLYIAAEFDHSQGNIDLQVFRGNTQEGFSASTNDREVVTVHDAIDLDDYEDQLSFTPDFNNIVMGLEPGTYYIRLYGDFNGQSYDLVVEPLSDDRYEVLENGDENDTQADAFPLGESIIGSSLSVLDGVGTIANYPVAATREDFVTDSGDFDWYSFSLPDGEIVGQIQLNYFSIDGGGISGVLDFSIVDSTGTVLESTGDGSTDPGVLIVNNPQARDFWIRVQAESDQAVLSGYDFGVTLEIEPQFVEDPIEDNYEENDRFDQLYNISGNEGRWLSGVAGYGTQLDADWYLISIPGNVAKFEATLYHFESEGDMDLSLSTRNGPLHFVADDGGNEETITWDNPLPRQYALTVTGQNRGNFYNLIWDLTYSEDNYEENDTRLTAFDLSENEGRPLSKLDGTGIQKDEDWYRIEADADSVQLRVTATFDHNEGDIDIALYNASGSTLRRSISSTDNEEILYMNPLPGEYFVRVYYGDAGNEYELSWTSLSQAELDVVPAGDDAYEPNNSADEAYELTRDEPRLSDLLGLGIQKNDDWYQFEVPDGNTGLYIQCLFSDVEGDIDFELYDPLGFPVAIRDSITDNEILNLDRPVPAGTYQIRVYGPDLGNEYELYWVPFIDDIYEENDDEEEAYDISSLVGAPLAGMPTLGDEDWYVVDVDRVTPFIQVDLEHLNINGAIDFQILDPDLNVLVTADSSDDLESVLLEIENGLYYVRVYSDEAYLYNNYDLTVTIFGDDPYEENDVSGEAADITATAQIDAVQFDPDWFSFEVTEANTFLSVIATFEHANGNIDLAVYDSSDLVNPIATSATNQNSESIRVEGVVGTYYIEITGDDINPAYQLLWTVSPDDQYEQNDELAEATDLTGGNGLSIEGIQYDEDWFEVVAAPGNLRLLVDLEYEQSGGNVNITLYDASGDEIAFEDTATDNETLAYALFPFGSTPETYYLKVSGGNLGNSYTLTWATSTEDNFEGETGNNVYSDPSDVLLDSEGVRISSTIGYGGSLDEDWYEVRINPGDDGIVIEAFFISTDDENIDLELFSAGEVFLRRSIGRSNVERIHYKGAPGTYYLRVFGKTGGNAYDLVWNSYKEDNLEIGVTTFETPDDPPDNDDPATPRSLFVPLDNFVARDSIDLEFIMLDELTQLDEDWYLVQVSAGEDVFIVDLEFEHIYGDIDVAIYDNATGTLIQQEESETDGERILVRDLPAGTYLICVYGYGINNPKATSGWAPGDFNPYTDDLVDWPGYDSIIENGMDDFYDLDEENARGLGNTYSLRWISSVEDEYDIETPSTGDIEVNDTRGTAAVPPLIDDQAGVLDDDGALDDTIRTVTLPNSEVVQYRPTYTYSGLAQFDEDWYEFTVDTGGAHDFFAAIAFNPLQANLDLFLYSADGTLINSNVGESLGAKLVEISGSGRTTYYVQVVGENLGTPYSLLVRAFFDDLAEENDNTQETDIQPEANITNLRDVDGYVPNLYVQRDEDYFRVDIPDDQVHIWFEVISQIVLEMEVLDSEGVPLPAGFEESGFPPIINYKAGVISPEGGTYYLKITTPTDAGFSYGIRWDFDNIDEYDDSQPINNVLGFVTNNNTPMQATNLTRLRLEPLYDPDDDGPLSPIKELAFDYGLLNGLTLDVPGNDPFGHAIQEDDDWYHIQIPSWFLTTARKGSRSVQVIKRHYYARLFAEIEFEHVDGDINLEIYDETNLLVPLARSETANDIESLFARIDPTDEARSYYLRVYGDNAANDYSLKWDVSIEDAYEQLEDNFEDENGIEFNTGNDTNNFVDLAYDLTNVDGVSTEGIWLHELEYLQDVNGDGVINALDGGFTSPSGYGIQTTDDWYAVVVSEGATQIMVDVRFYSDNDTGYEYDPDDLDIDFEVYFLAGNDGDPGTADLRKPVLIGRSTEDTDETIFNDTGEESEDLSADITEEVQETATFDVDEPGIYFIRIYYDNRSHPYTFMWDDIGGVEDPSGDAAIIEDYLTGDWSLVIPAQLPGAAIVDPAADLDGDQFPNWAEFALGMDASVAEHSVISQSIAEIDGKQYYQIEFTRNIHAEGLGYEFIVQESENLNFGAGRAEHVEDIPIPGTDLERAVYRCSKPIDEQSRCFFRMVVNEPPASDK